MNERDYKDKSAAQLVAEERERQKKKLGYTKEHDQKINGYGELLAAAISYITPPESREYEWEHGMAPTTWPWADKHWSPSRDRLWELIRAEALLQAEIDRMLEATVMAKEMEVISEAMASSLVSCPPYPVRLSGLYIVNEADRPCEWLIAARIDDRLHYIHPVIRDKGYYNMSVRYAVPLSNFGIEVVLQKGWVYGKTVGPSKVEIEGQERLWQGNPRFSFPWKASKNILEDGNGK